MMRNAWEKLFGECPGGEMSGELSRGVSSESCPGNCPGFINGYNSCLCHTLTVAVHLSNTS
jgi:hypothetical protein